MTLKEEVYTMIAALMTAAFGLIAALAWNGAIQAIFKQVFGTVDSIPAQLSYAIIVTIIAVIVTILIARSLAQAKGEQKK
jgi:TRAP-type C4-dicarboxylate transport system permease small subunit